ncbi:MAG: type 4a pilus biogenesis protein PilO [Candidatus Omnitrophica bacterium]|nr:type 4a pilus biogenesis protein PilO [Candidatus Omnitrophota bacterium]
MVNLLKLDKKKAILIIFASLVIIYIDSSLIIKMQRKGIKTVQEKVTKLKQEIVTLNKDLAAMYDLESKQVDIKSETVLRAKKIISEGGIPLLLEDISNIANKRNVKIMQVNPSKESKAKEEVSFGKEKLKSVVITLDLMCDYHGFGGFINDLDNAEQFMAIQEMKIVPNPKDYFQQRVILVLKTYVKK